MCSDVLRHASKGDLRRAAKAAADAARHQTEPVAAAVGQATKEAAQSVGTVRDILQGEALLQAFTSTSNSLSVVSLDQKHCALQEGNKMERPCYGK